VIESAARDRLAGAADELKFNESLGTLHPAPCEEAAMKRFTALVGLVAFAFFGCGSSERQKTGELTRARAKELVSLSPGYVEGLRVTVELGVWTTSVSSSDFPLRWRRIFAEAGYVTNFEEERKSLGLGDIYSYVQLTAEGKAKCRLDKHKLPGGKDFEVCALRVGTPRVVEVTGITGDAQRKEVHYTWQAVPSSDERQLEQVLKPLVRLCESLGPGSLALLDDWYRASVDTRCTAYKRWMEGFEKPQEDVAVFKLYDDGWRLESRGKMSK
jgi:hypothetical protein